MPAAYIEPQCFSNPEYKRSLKSDIYSYGVTPWKISSGRKPFQSFRSREALAIHIFHGYREEPIEDTPQQYFELYKCCWDSDPTKRPDMNSILDSLNKIILEPKNLQIIAEGGFSQVYKSEWKDRRLTIALKCLKVDMNMDITNVEKLVKEFLSNRQFNMVLQFAENGNLREYLIAKFSILNWDDKLRIAKEIAQGLAFLHKINIVHRDLHSKNILVHQGKMMIADFGLSKVITNNNSFSNSIVHGMPAYIEPNWYKDQKYKRNKMSDIYSLGVILWEISSGKRPFQSLEALEIPIRITNGERETPVEDTPRQYVELYTRCWDDSPTKRPDINSIIEYLNSLDVVQAKP
ncbi:kinase-like domain-containing protein [Gigaspora rosea]|uniref:Kinase-like domain-containing protein n=1 Tax=Gigaspora rosea TaxID=44941 RepID=A0A397UQ76_9GLOM|nr:kinase-like domain-containing protein [Gigaspora rosea]